MNPLVAEIERLQEWDGLWGATRNGVTKYEPILAALKLAVEYVGKCDCDGCVEVLRAIAEKLGVEG